MLGKLARILRMIGQDAEYVREGDAQQIARRAKEEGRVLLTRDTRLAAQSTGGVLFIESNYPFHQARQAIRDLALVLDPSFRRCVEDNGLLSPAAKAEVEGEVPSYIFATHDLFMRCDRCRRVFWEGSHLDGMRKVMAELDGAPLVRGEHEITEADQGEVRSLEPLLDLHQALEVLLLEHRVALMRSDVGAALRSFRRFAIWMRRHIQDESELVLPVYARHPPASGYPRGASPEVFEGDHAKILEHLDRCGAALEELRASDLSGDALHVACLGVIDREKIFVDLCDHHDRRERAYLYPHLETVLDDREKAALLERMVGPRDP
jgi:uncharacterized protein with PIN domain